MFGGGWPGKLRRGQKSAQQSEQSARAGQRASAPSGQSAPAGQQEPQHGGEAARKRLILLTAVVVTVLAAGAAYALIHSGTGRPAASEPAGQKPAGGSGPFKVVSMTPAAGAGQVDGSQPIEISFSGDLSASSPKPVLVPSIAGSWTQTGSLLTFTPATALRPDATETVEVPAGLSGVRSATGAQLADPVVDRFTTTGYSPARLAELLGQLGYLPMTWSLVAPAGMAHTSEAAWDQDTSQQAMAYDPPAGAYSWQQGYPATLTSMWNPGGPNLILKGAVMAFESQHGMTIDGAVSPALWASVFSAVARGAVNQDGYTYAIASKSLPETLTIWHDGRVVMHSLANTGIPVSPTVDGTFPVYQRFRFQIMQGTNPDGSSYADPVSFVSYFNGGDAVHYFPRGSYGFQQSLGCVELPYTSAERAFPYLTYGSLVTVAG